MHTYFESHHMNVDRCVYVCNAPKTLTGLSFIILIKDYGATLEAVKQRLLINIPHAKRTFVHNDLQV